MNISVTKKDVFWSYIARSLQLGSSLFLLPFILKFVPTEELAVWYIFIAISTFVMLLDFGLSPTILRNVTYVFSGVKTLKSAGIEDGVCTNVIDYTLLYILIRGIKKTYRIISLIALIILSTGGTLYIFSINSQNTLSFDYTIYWFIYVGSTCLNLYYLYFFPLIMGCGKQRKQYQITIVCKIVNLLITFVGIVLGYGLAALVIGVFVSTLINRFLSYRIFYDAKIRKGLLLGSMQKSDINIFKVIWEGSYKLGIVSIANFLITNGSIFIVTSFSDLQTVAQYGLTYQVLATLVSVSQIFFGTYIPTFNSLRLKGENELLKKSISLAMVVSFLLYIIGGSLLLLVGNKLLMLLGSSTLLLPNNMLLMLLLIYLLDFNHNNCATIISTNNIIPYAYPMLVSGCLVAVFSWILYSLTPLGVWSIIISQGTIQLMYNNWIWPYRLNRYMNIKYSDLIHDGIKQICLSIIHLNEYENRNSSIL